jgi:hypothetical protein
MNVHWAEPALRGNSEGAGIYTFLVTTPDQDEYVSKTSPPQPDKKPLAVNDFIPCVKSYQGR